MEAALAPFQAQVRLIETLPGAGRESAMAILVELGPDMSVFASARHCAAWAGICPGNNESAGKRRSGRMRRGNPILRAILVECSHAAVRTLGCQFQAYHRAVTSRRGYKRAIVAVAHKMLRIIYAMLRDGKPYADPGIDYERISISRKASRWLQKLEQYGYVTRRAREEQTDMSARPA
ncbi:MAG: transposase [Albidovulum sp.]|nr:transposase [Albidovulum sp.]